MDESELRGKEETEGSEEFENDSKMNSSEAKTSWVTFYPQIGNGKWSTPRTFLQNPTSSETKPASLVPPNDILIDTLSDSVELTSREVFEDDDSMRTADDPLSPNVTVEDDVKSKDGVLGEEDVETEGERMGEEKKSIPNDPSGRTYTTIQKREALSRVVSGVIFRLDRRHGPPVSFTKKGRRRGKRYVVALQDYYATIADVLSLQKNDIIVVTGFVSTHWREGTNLRTCASGIFPLMYIRDACATEVAATFLKPKRPGLGPCCHLIRSSLPFI